MIVFFQLIAEFAGIFILAEIFCRVTMHQGLWKSVKGLFPEQVENAVTSLTDPLPGEREEEDRISKLRRELEHAKEEVRLAEQQGALSEELADKRRALRSARAKLARAEQELRQADEQGDSLL